MEYRLATQSPSALATHVLERDRLVIVHEKNDRREEVLFSDIRAITLQRTLGAYVLRMTRGAGRPIMIRSRYVARGGFEDRLAEYAALVTRLHEAILAENPAIKFVGGSTQFYWLGWLLVALGVGFAALFVGALVAGLPRSFEAQVADLGGIRRTIAWTFTAVADDGGELRNLVGIGLDNTERRAAELMIYQSAKLVTLGEMATGLAHELNQPLNAIKLTVENVLLRSSRGTPEKTYLDDKLDKIRRNELTCDYALPVPDNNEKVDLEKVNIRFVDELGYVDFLYVESAANCSKAEYGWYFDNPASPKKVVLCNPFCDEVKASRLGKIDVVLGCKRQEAKIR